MAPACLRRAALAFEFGDEARALFEQRREVLIAARDRAGVVADLFVQLGEPFFEIGAHITIRSTNSFTGVSSRRRWSMHRSRIAFCCCGGKRRGRVGSNFS